MSEVVTNRLAEIEARANAASKGPWVWEAPRGYPQRITNAQALVIAETYISPDAPADDTEFITHAREDVPALVAAVRAVLEVIEKAAKRRDACNARIAALYDKYRDEHGEIRGEANHDPAIRYLEGRAGCSAGLEDELSGALAAALGEQVNTRG